MHLHAREFVARHATDGSTLEVGGRDINGGVRDLFDGDYTSVDLYDGPGVDVVGDITDLDLDTFDTVVCCEVLEHAEDAAGIIAGCARHLSGVLLLTCATDPRTPHSAHDGGKLRPGEFYRNVNPADLEGWLEDAGLTVDVFEVHDGRGDLYVKAHT
jgi:hypothetical protein